MNSISDIYLLFEGHPLSQFGLKQYSIDLFYDKKVVIYEQ